MLKKPFFFFVLITFLKVSYELDCTTLTGPTCGNHNTNYKLQCHQFGANSNCVEIEVDDGCQIKDDHTCEKTDANSNSYECYNAGSEINKCKRINVVSGCKLEINSNNPHCSRDTENIQENEDCFLSKDLKTCEKKTKSCSLYSDSNCGGLKGSITNNKQCIFDDECKEITIDDKCQYFDTNNLCDKKSGVTFDEVKNKCIMNSAKTECKLHPLTCNDYSEYYDDLTKCANFGNTCHKIKIDGSSQSKCKIVTITSTECDINDDGECTTKTGQTVKNYQKCSYNSDYTKCELINKECSEMDINECSNCKTSPAGFKCSKVDYDSAKCRNININSNCKINSEGNCIKISGEEDKNECHFIQADSKCQYYEVDQYCKISFLVPNVNCENDDGLNDENRICELEGTKCKPRNKNKCREFGTETSCTNFLTSGDKRCFWLTGDECKEYTVDDFCRITSNRECTRKNDLAPSSFGDNEECLFDYTLNSCKKKEKKCEHYYNNCNEHITAGFENVQCVQYREEDYCRQISIDNKCNVVGNDCVPQNTIDSEEICAFDNELKPTSCNVRSRICKELDNCNSINNCAKVPSIPDKCFVIEIDNKCTLNSGDCQNKESATLNSYEKCDFVRNDQDGDKYFCKPTTKNCGDYDNTKQTECNNHPETDNHQCFYFDHCIEVHLDDYCHVDSNGICVEKSAGKLKSNEICEFSPDKRYCSKREKKCEDYNDANCGNYIPETKLCFNFNSDPAGHCKEVKIDSRCSINENNQCTGNSCSFDDDNDKCYYKGSSKGNEGPSFKFKQFILLMLFFVL